MELRLGIPPLLPHKTLNMHSRVQISYSRPDWGQSISKGSLEAELGTWYLDSNGQIYRKMAVSVSNSRLVLVLVTYFILLSLIPPHTWYYQAVRLFTREWPHQRCYVTTWAWASLRQHRVMSPHTNRNSPRSASGDQRHLFSLSRSEDPDAGDRSCRIQAHWTLDNINR